MTDPTPFAPGFALDAGEALNMAFAHPYLSYEGGITAAAGGGKTNARVLSSRIAVVDTVATGNDSVLLMSAVKGKWMLVMNNAASNSMQVFGKGNDTINGVATGTGVAQAAGKAGLYFCAVNGAWFRLLSA
jgi:hypothetical protein